MKKKLSKKIGEGIKKGIKAIPSRIYKFSFLALVLGSLSFIVASIFVQFAQLEVEKFKLDHSYYVTADSTLENSSQVREEIKALRQSYINKDLNDSKNLLDLAKCHIQRRFASVDIFGETFIVLALAYADYKTIIWFVSPAFSLKAKIKERNEKKKVSKHAEVA